MNRPAAALPHAGPTLTREGLPLVLSRYNRNVFFAIGLCVVVVVGFYLVVLGSQYLGSSYLISPAGLIVHSRAGFDPRENAKIEALIRTALPQ